MPNASPSGSASSSRRSNRRWIILTVAAIFFGFVLYQVLNPFPDQPYIEISHGNHTHYMPKDRNPDVPVSQFPQEPPGPDERITPDGRIVPKQ